LRVPWTARSSQQSILKEINPEYSLEELMLKVKLQYFGLLGGSVSKEPMCNVGNLVQSLGWEDSLEEDIATHSSILTWRIPWTEEPDGLQSMGVPKSWTSLSD